MIRSTTFLLILLTLSGFSERPEGYVRKSEKIREFTITENDTTSYTLKLAFNELDQPSYFFRNVFTPVCLTGECKPVYINFYWDLLGNYTRYDLPPGEVLTKMDHREFKQEDYDKLRDILDNTNSLLKDVAMEDLVGKGTENLADSVDAKAGATLKTVKNEVIDGAVYTCYTLWHIAHGKVADEMQKITESYRTDDLLHRFLTSSNYHYQYWAMEKVVDKAGNVVEAFTTDMLQIIRGKNVFTARSALQKISNPFFASNARQVWLWETYQSAGYPMQIAILKKLAKIPFQNSLAEATAKAMVNANREQFTLMLKLLETQPKLSEKALQTMASELDTPNQDYATEINRVLTNFHPKNRAVVAKMNAFKHKATQTR
ncbi:hypothetical protein EXU85_34095 [Spirosoma sp. KCTC 42546]|uniref:hypothetical protein n=1 Tax=Spirosoma sp. KCTC 42546 TaxID=2520506 RepID=UPI001158C5F1|nr:hypothetical protein [Spirosoma sp. KCTC 42546]QDK83368.1 hypothetical protein EXU85_34095 [Spirosoma sp. KCTC 42546]